MTSEVEARSAGTYSTTDMGPFVASHSDRDRSQRRARKPIASPVTAATAERLAGDQFMIVETGQLELADSNVTPDFVNHRAATENGSLWLRTSLSRRRRWQRHDDRRIF